MYNFSTEKLLTLLSVVSKQEITYQLDPKKLYSKILPPKFVYISPMLFRSYQCPLGCDWCCPRFSLDFFPFNVERFKSRYPELASRLQDVEVLVNGQKRIVTTDLQKDGLVNKCRYVNEERRCSIHDENPLSCQIEIIKFIRRGCRGYLSKQKFGRGWVVRSGTKARCEIGPFNLKQFESDILILKEYQKFAEYFEIPSWLPEIIKILEGINVNSLPKDKIPVGINP